MFQSRSNVFRPALEKFTFRTSNNSETLQQIRCHFSLNHTATFNEIDQKKTQKSWLITFGEQKPPKNVGELRKFGNDVYFFNNRRNRDKKLVLYSSWDNCLSLKIGKSFFFNVHDTRLRVFATYLRKRDVTSGRMYSLHWFMRILDRGTTCLKEISINS